MDLNRKRVLLTGASGGIGQAIAAELAAAGASLFLVGRSHEKLEAIRSSLPEPDRHVVFPADLTREADLERLNKEGNRLNQSGQGIDIVINNAGANEFNFLSRRSAVSVRQELDLNLLAPILMSQLALNWLNRPGIILNIGSAFGGIGYPGYTVYCSAKAGVYRFSEALDRELDGSGIRVLYVAPRATDTDLNSPVVKQMNQELGNRSDSPQTVAKVVVESLRKETTSRWIGWPEKLFVRINQIFPTVVTQSIRRQQARIHHFIELINSGKL
ncbi:SDR family oxidoreductase [Vibrio mangrovi]|uniref:3-oxoacyl-[acyl-carrier-protein] reductase FabG n=1 Tax=Vibrio mangrovi TaxID=474394 RepID=A0A1Y6IZC1_9VIBR|nr:SDR family oxidoreductase [Vibrio mangrovi]MDW6005091.1 SDR family oxidoreductase [Vibrio mangrovi]SMS02986.1 3-oxoacyl-[acyl-carrier-protein] reductase FabG [Vibrio mangrovi]